MIDPPQAPIDTTSILRLRIVEPLDHRLSRIRLLPFWMTETLKVVPPMSGAITSGWPGRKSQSALAADHAAAGDRIPEFRSRRSGVMSGEQAS